MAYLPVTCTGRAPACDYRHVRAHACRSSSKPGMRTCHVDPSSPPSPPCPSRSPPRYSGPAAHRRHHRRRTARPRADREGDRRTARRQARPRPGPRPRARSPPSSSSTRSPAARSRPTAAPPPRSRRPPPTPRRSPTRSSRSRPPPARPPPPPRSRSRRSPTSSRARWSPATPRRSGRWPSPPTWSPSTASPRRPPTNAHNVEFTRALKVWQDTGQTGEGVRIGVIDTGLDYTHADFGGPGTVEAYEAGVRRGRLRPRSSEGLYDPAKFIGGYDFAGALYSASDDIEGASPVPTPDENPIDATYLSDNSGHGTHVVRHRGRLRRPARRHDVRRRLQRPDRRLRLARRPRHRTGRGDLRAQGVR